MTKLAGLAFILLFPLAAFAQQPEVRGLDHVPIVVRDLDRAVADFGMLGFALRPGRPHDNGLRNAHIKFADGTAIELVSPDAPTDALARDYLAWLKEGEGPVAVGLYQPAGSPLIRSSRYDGMFFDRRQGAPTDRWENFAHPNGAHALSGVWLAGSPAERALQSGEFGRLVERDTCSPVGPSVRALVLDEGEVLFLPASARIVRQRPIVAVTMTVESLDKARPFAFRQVEGCTRKSTWALMHGVWLEFHER